MLTFHNKQYSLQVQVVKLKKVYGQHPQPSFWMAISEGNSVTFPVEFKNIPAVMVIPPVGSNGLWIADAVSTTDCYLRLADGTIQPEMNEIETNLPADIDFEIVIAAFERP